MGLLVRLEHVCIGLVLGKHNSEDAPFPYGADHNADDEHAIQSTSLPCMQDDLNTRQSTERHANQHIAEIRKAEMLVLHDDLLSLSALTRNITT